MIDKIAEGGLDSSRSSMISRQRHTTTNDRARPSDVSVVGSGEPNNNADEK